MVRIKRKAEKISWRLLGVVNDSGSEGVGLVVVEERGWHSVVGVGCCDVITSQGRGKKEGDYEQR